MHKNIHPFNTAGLQSVLKPWLASAYAAGGRGCGVWFGDLKETTLRKFTTVDVRNLLHASDQSCTCLFERVANSGLEIKPLVPVRGPCNTKLIYSCF